MSGPSDGGSSKWSRPVLGKKKPDDKASNVDDSSQEKKVDLAPEMDDDDERTEVSSVAELMNILGDSESWDEVEGDFKSGDVGTISLKSLETPALNLDDENPSAPLKDLPLEQDGEASKKAAVPELPPTPPTAAKDEQASAVEPSSTEGDDDDNYVSSDGSSSIVMSLEQANLAGMMHEQSAASLAAIESAEMESFLGLLTPSERQAYDDELAEMLAAGMTDDERLVFEEEKRAEIYEKLTPAERQLFEEEQREKALAAMTPAEREAYYAQELDRERRKRLEREAKQREFVETYAQSVAPPQKSAPIALIVGILGVVIFVTLLFIFLISESDEDSDVIAQDEVAEEELPPAAVVAKPLSYAPVKVDVLADAMLFINGVKVDPSSELQFVVGKTNTVMAYYDGMMPYFKTFDAGAIPDDVIDIEFEADILYNTTSVEFKFSDLNIETYDMKATLNGKRLSRFPSTISDLAMGRPHILTLEKPGFAKHMHVFWLSDLKGNTVTIPELVTEYNAASGTTCDIKKFPVSAKPYSLRIQSGENKYASPTLVTVPKGGLIEYTVARDQRHMLKLAIYPEGFGTLSVDTDLLVKSIGEAVVKFSSSKKSDMQVCIRRIGEVICPPMNQDSTIPSGLKWEVFGYSGEKGNIKLLRNIYSQNFQSTRAYNISVDVDARGSFSMKLESSRRLKK